MVTRHIARNSNCEYINAFMLGYYLNKSIGLLSFQVMLIACHVTLWTNSNRARMFIFILFPLDFKSVCSVFKVCNVHIIYYWIQKIVYLQTCGSDLWFVKFMQWMCDLFNRVQLSRKNYGYRCCRRKRKQNWSDFEWKFDGASLPLTDWSACSSWRDLRLLLVI